MPLNYYDIVACVFVAVVLFIGRFLLIRFDRLKIPLFLPLRLTLIIFATLFMGIMALFSFEEMVHICEREMGTEKAAAMDTFSKFAYVVGETSKNLGGKKIARMPLFYIFFGVFMILTFGIRDLIMDYDNSQITWWCYVLLIMVCFFSAMTFLLSEKAISEKYASDGHSIDREYHRKTSAPIKIYV